MEYPVDVYGFGNKKNAQPTIRRSYGPGDELGPSFVLLDEIDKWLEDNIGYKNYSASTHATEAYIGLWATIYFKRQEDAVLFQLTWG